MSILCKEHEYSQNKITKKKMPERKQQLMTKVCVKFVH